MYAGGGIVVTPKQREIEETGMGEVQALLSIKRNEWSGKACLSVRQWMEIEWKGLQGSGKEWFGVESSIEGWCGEEWNEKYCRRVEVSGI